MCLFKLKKKKSLNRIGFPSCHSISSNPMFYRKLRISMTWFPFPFLLPSPLLLLSSSAATLSYVTLQTCGRDPFPHFPQNTLKKSVVYKHSSLGLLDIPDAECFSVASVLRSLTPQQWDPSSICPDWPPVCNSRMAPKPFIAHRKRVLLSLPPLSPNSFQPESLI